MKKLTSFWIYGNTYGVVNMIDSTLVFIGKLHEAEDECKRLSKIVSSQKQEEYEHYEVIKLTDDCSEVFSKKED